MVQTDSCTLFTVTKIKRDSHLRFSLISFAPCASRIFLIAFFQNYKNKNFCILFVQTKNSFFLFFRFFLELRYLICRDYNQNCQIPSLFVLSGTLQWWIHICKKLSSIRGVGFDLYLRVCVSFKKKKIRYLHYFCST